MSSVFSEMGQSGREFKIAQLMKSENRLSNNADKIVFSGFFRGFPQAPKVWGTGGIKFQNSLKKT